MDRDTAKALLPIITAFANGEIIQCNASGDGWRDLTEPTWSARTDSYRVKPKTKTLGYGVLLVNVGGSKLLVSTTNKEHFDHILKDINTLKIIKNWEEFEVEV